MFTFSSFQMIVNSANFFDASKRCLSKEMSSPYLWMSTSRRYVLMTCHISLVSHPQLYQNLTATIIVLISRASLTFTFWYSYLIAYINTLFFLGCLFGNVDAIKWQEPRKFWAWPWEQWRTHGKVNCLITTFKFLSASKPRNIYLKTLQLMKTVMLKTLDIMFWSKSIC